MQRVGFILKVKEDKIEEYRKHHDHVWPEMLEALREAGWHNYSLFMREDGLLFAGHSENFSSITQSLRLRSHTVYERALGKGLRATKVSA